MDREGGLCDGGVCLHDPPCGLWLRVGSCAKENGAEEEEDIREGGQ